MTYVDNSPLKMILQTHQDNNTIFNSVTTGHFLKATSVCINRKLTKSPLSVALPDVSRINFTHTALFSPVNLPEAARHAHTFTELK